MQVIGENNFHVPSTSFAISPSSSGYQLQYSADAEHFTSYSDAVPSGETVIVNFGVKNMVYRLSGNTDTVYILY